MQLRKINKNILLIILFMLTIGLFACEIPHEHEYINGECVCGEKEPHIHSYGNWEVVKEATELEEGLKIRTCSCGEKETEVISKLDKSDNDVPEFITDIFGEDVVMYDNDDVNPYNINLDKYGSDVYAIFYEPDFESISDPYVGVSKTEFYNNYEVATSYEDSMYRTNHGLMSGDITPQGHIPETSDLDNTIRCTTATYVLSTDGSYLAYIPNSINEDTIIFYGAAYTSLNDVANYLLAFGEVPKNSNYNKNSKGRNQSVSEWGEYGRCNTGAFSGDTSKYPYEPLLPTITKNRFVETDFGTLGGYSNINEVTGTTYHQEIYNDGTRIERGAARFVFTSDSSVTSIDERYVFYTYNHYNDFQEFLNYENGWGIRFGNVSAGNPYCSSSKDYYASNLYPVGLYPETIKKSSTDLK